MRTGFGEYFKEEENEKEDQFIIYDNYAGSTDMYGVFRMWLAVRR